MEYKYDITEEKKQKLREITINAIKREQELKGDTMCEEVYDLDYNDALEYFGADADTLEFLKELDEDEKENLHLQLVVNHEEKWAIWRMGHWFRDTKNLSQLGNGIDNTDDHEDDYEAVVELIREQGWKPTE